MNNSLTHAKIKPTRVNAKIKMDITKPATTSVTVISFKK
jgi:hypothetical protein